MGGNPWAQTADAYGQGLNQLSQLEMQQANAPMKLQQMFAEQYMAAKKQRMQEEEAARRIAQDEAMMKHRMALERLAESRAQAEDINKTRKSKYDFMKQSADFTPKEEEMYQGEYKALGLPSPATYAEPKPAEVLGSSRVHVGNGPDGSVELSKPSNEMFSMPQEPASTEPIFLGGRNYLGNQEKARIKREMDQVDAALKYARTENERMELKRKGVQLLSEQAALDLGTPQAKVDLLKAQASKALRPPSSGSGGGGGMDLTPEALAGLSQNYIDRGGDGAALSGLGRNNKAKIQVINNVFANKEEPVNLSDANLRFKNKGDAFKYWSVGKGADSLRQQKVILDHTKTFTKIAEALDNGDMQLANSLGAKLGAKFGSDKASNFKMAGTILAQEVGTYLAKGPGTGEERKELVELLPVFSSPEQFRGGLSTLAELISSQNKALKEQKRISFSGDVESDGLGNNAQKKKPALPKGFVRDREREAKLIREGKATQAQLDAEFGGR